MVAGHERGIVGRRDDRGDVRSLSLENPMLDTCARGRLGVNSASLWAGPTGEILRDRHHRGTRVSDGTDRIGKRGIGAAAGLTDTGVAAGRRGDGARIATHNRVVVDQRECHAAAGEAN
jgi:hypothetical protein